MERNIKNIIKNAIYEALSDKKAEVLTEQIMKHIILEADDTKKKKYGCKTKRGIKTITKQSSEKLTICLRIMASKRSI